MPTHADNDVRPKSAASPYVIEEADNFRVSTAAYRGREIFEEELEKIFYKTWIFLAHESEISQPGDFKSTMIGMQPVILTRDENGVVNAFLNACTHRGGNLARVEKGNTRSFVCPYHGWAFKTSGELFAVPAPERQPASFDMSKLGMHKIARVAQYGGLVFGSFNADVEELESYLGEAKRHIDLWNARTAQGKYRAGTSHKYAYHGNWKFQAENVYDGYHAGFVHRSAFNTMRKFEGLFRNRHYGAVRSDGLTRGLPNGHGTLELGMPLESGQVAPEIKQQYQDMIATMYGEEMVNDILCNRHLLLFPSVVIMDFNIRVIQPRGHDHTDVYSYPMLIDGVPEEISSQRMDDVQTRVGPAGIVGADDIEVFHGIQTSLGALGAKWTTISRGLGQEEVLPSGERIGAFSDETPQRAFWRRWNASMTVQAKGEQA